jgi:hypothetical protein
LHYAGDCSWSTGKEASPIVLLSLLTSLAGAAGNQTEIKFNMGAEFGGLLFMGITSFH